MLQLYHTWQQSLFQVQRLQAYNPCDSNEMLFHVYGWLWLEHSM